MKKICNFIKNSIIFIYILLIIFVTICLLSYNDYKITVFGDKSLIPIIDENLEPDYTIGDLVIVEKSKLSKVKEGDVVFFYRTFAGEATINYAKLTGVERVTDTEYTFTVEGDYKFSSTYYIGNADSIVIIPKVGHVLTVLESKWGFLFLGVFPSLVAFLYTLYSIIAEVRYNDDNEEDSDSTDGNHSKDAQSTENVKEEKTEESVKEPEKIESTEEVKEEDKEDKTESGEIKTKENEIHETKVTEKDKTEEIKEQPKEENKKESKTKAITAEQKKALVEAKLKSMSEEEKKALIEAKLKSMTDEEKRALIEAKKKKMEEQKNNK